MAKTTLFSFLDIHGDVVDGLTIHAVELLVILTLLNWLIMGNLAVNGTEIIDVTLHKFHLFILVPHFFFIIFVNQQRSENFFIELDEIVAASFLVLGHSWLEDIYLPSIWEFHVGVLELIKMLLWLLILCLLLFILREHWGSRLSSLLGVTS